MIITVRKVLANVSIEHDHLSSSDYNGPGNSICSKPNDARALRIRVGNLIYVSSLDNEFFIPSLQPQAKNTDIIKTSAQQCKLCMCWNALNKHIKDPTTSTHNLIHDYDVMYNSSLANASTNPNQKILRNMIL